MLRSLFKHSGVYFLGLMGNKIINVLMWIILARLFEPEFVGLIILFLTVGEITTFIADFGLNQWYMKMATESDRDEKFLQSLSARAFTLLLSISILSVFLFTLKMFSTTVTVVLLISLIPKAIVSLLDGYFLERKQSLQIAIKNTVTTLLFLSGFLITGQAMTMDSTAILYVCALVFTVVVFFPWRVLQKFRMDSLTSIQTTLKNSSSYAMLILSSYLYARGDSLLVGYLAGSAALGAYGMAYRYLEGLSLFPTAIVQNLFPVSAKKGTVGRLQLKQITVIMAFLGTLSSVFIYLLAEPLVFFILGNKYSSAVPILQIFSLVLILFFVNAPLSAIVQSSEMVKKFLPFGIFNTALNLVLNLMTIPLFGAEGAAWVMATTEFTGLLINLYFIAKLYPPKNKYLRQLVGFMAVDEDKIKYEVEGSGYSIIIVHWNTPTILRKQLEILSGITNSEITVVDNASSENIAWIRNYFPNVRLIVNKFNRGFAAACNQGAAVSTREWLLFLNPDVRIDKDEIESLIRYAKEKKLDACSPTPESDDYKKPVPSWWTLLIEFTPLKRILWNKIQSIVDYHTLTGGCVLIHSKVFRYLGGWDERYFLWFEDSDLTKRLLNNDYRIGWAPFFVNHIGGVSFADLGIQEKRDLFFHAMRVYAHTHFGFFGRYIVDKMTQRYSKRKTLRKLHRGVSIVVPNMLPELLATFFESNSEPLKNTEELIVVTSSITPDKIWDWRNKYPDVRFIPITENHGFASTVNIGMRAATGSWIGTINDDCIAHGNWIEECLKNDSMKVGGINPVVFRTDRSVESAGVKVLPKGKALPQTHVPKYPVRVDALNAAAVLYKNETLNEVGLFDEKFGSYLEDIDLSIRMKRRGWESIVSPRATVMHKGHSTSTSALGGMKAFYDFRNWIFLICKNWTFEEKLRFAPEIIIERLRNLSGVIKSS